MKKTNSTHGEWRVEYPPTPHTSTSWFDRVLYTAGMPKQLVTAFLAVFFLHQSFTWVIFGLWDEARDEVVSLAKSRMTSTTAVSNGGDGTSGDNISSSIPSDASVDCSPSHSNSTTDSTPTIIIGGAQKAGTTNCTLLVTPSSHQHCIVTMA